MSAARKTAKIEMPSIAESRTVTAAAKSVPDALPLADSQLGATIPMRGRPRSDVVIDSPSP